MTAAMIATAPGNAALRNPETRERNAQRGIRHCSEIVASHVEGQRRGEHFIVSLCHLSPRADELMALAIDVASDTTYEGRAHARGFFRALQKRLEATAP